jgi:type II secretory pathway pseudopilin PulG
VINKKNNIIKKTAFSLIELGVAVVVVAVIAGSIFIFGKRVIATAKCSGAQIAVGDKSDTYSDMFKNHKQAAATLDSIDADKAFKDCINSEMGLAAASCKDILANNAGAASGVYTLDVGNIKVYCDMATDGGGWTLVAAQYESDVADEAFDGGPGGVNTWNEGIQGDYMIDNPGFNSAILDNDTLGSIDAGFTFNASEIPTHMQVAFGKGSNPTFIGYSNTDLLPSGQYTPGNIAKTLLTDLGGSGNYHVHRDSAGRYGGLDPENTFYTTPDAYFNTLTYDKSEVIGLNFAFSPLRPDTISRGYYMNGPTHTGTDVFSWTIWVR